MTLMRRAAVLLIANFVVLVFVGGWLAQSLLIIQRIAAVSEVQGQVEVRRRDTRDFVPLGTTRHVVAGDVLRTDPSSSMTLNWADGSRIRVGPGSTLQVMKCQFNTARKADTYLFRLDVGQVWVRVLKALSGPSKFEIRTPTATAGVRGTVFSVHVDTTGATRVSVLEGEVALQGKAGALAVGRNQQADTDAATTGSAVPLAADEAARWAEARAVALPRLSVTEPVEGRTLPRTGPIRVAGKAERGAQVTVNGQPVTLNVRAEFDVQVPVSSCADGALVVKARDAKGFESERVIRLRP